MDTSIMLERLPTCKMQDLRVLLIEDLFSEYQTIIENQPSCNSRDLQVFIKDK
jgi:hypothetical protein